jgi:hypothetical protein
MCFHLRYENISLLPSTFSYIVTLRKVIKYEHPQDFTIIVFKTALERENKCDSSIGIRNI